MIILSKSKELGMTKGRYYTKGGFKMMNGKYLDPYSNDKNIINLL